MRIDIGQSPVNYLCGMGTLIAAIYSFQIAVSLGTSPVSLLVHLIAFFFLILGMIILFRSFTKAEREYDEAELLLSRNKRAAARNVNQNPS